MATLTKAFAESSGDAAALVDEQSTTTWAELDERVNRLIHALGNAGLGVGDTLAIVAGNRREWFELSLACAHAGIIYVPVNWHLVAAEIAYILEDSGSRAVMVGHRFVDVVAGALDDERSAAVEIALVAGDAGEDGLDPRFTSYDDFLASGSPDEPAEQFFGGPMFYTSGTTGNPKGVKGALSNATDQAGPEIWQLIVGGFSEMLPIPGVTLLCGPVYHSAQWAFSWLPLLAGSSVVMQHKYDSAEVLKLIDAHQATNIHLVPTQMKRLVDLDESTRQAFDGSSLEVVLHGAAPCPPAVKRQLIDWWGPKITEYYGSTEGSIITMISAEEWLDRGGSVGQAQPTMEIMVIGEDGQPVADGESGTLYFRSKMGSDFEYHNAPQKTADAHREPGVFTTGDMGYVDADGYLWLSDRKIDMIISGGVNIYPAEVEKCLGGHPMVADVAVIGVPNEEFGEEVKAVVVACDGVAGDDGLARILDTFCRSELAGFKVPRSIDFANELPRTGTGKVQKRKLREPYWADHERNI